MAVFSTEKENTMVVLTGLLVGFGISMVISSTKSGGVRVFIVGLFVLLVGAYLSLHFAPWQVI